MEQKRIYWNRDWQFLPQFTEELLELSCQKPLQQVTLPHTVEETPYHYFDEHIYQKVCGYRRVFKADRSWQDKKVLMTIEAAGHSAWVYLNGEQITEHHCGYTSFQADLSKCLLYDKENVLVIKVDSTEAQNIPPFGHVIDYMTFGGLYREVYLEIKQESYLEDVFARTKGIMEQKPVLECDVTLHVSGKKLTLGVDWKKEETVRSLLVKEGLTIQQTMEAEQGTESWNFAKNQLQHKVEQISLWDTEHPVLYRLRTELRRHEELIDVREQRIGFREVEFRADGFYLNGTKLKLRGLNRHQSFPYVGYAMPRSMQRYDADILKKELGVNAVRTSHYPQSHYFLERCDELGLLVFTEIPGWQHIGDEKWQQQAIENTREMVLQYRNHPSIMLWGVRINESADNDEFYRRTNEVAHSLDETRQTSGVRFIQKSSLLEDVYAYNDFSHQGDNAGCKKKKRVTPDSTKGYLISEYNGHMYPTKPFDAEGHRVEHLLRHARVMNAYYGEEDIAGGFGWCMFDYNTHQDFGSGDRICYHGVCDMFRNPKQAAALYKSQDSEETVLEVSSSMDIGEHPACLMKKVYVVTNADSVKLYKNDVFIREFQASETPFPNLLHGPICIDDLIGNQIEEGEGFSKSKAKDIKEILMEAARNGMDNLPLRIKLLAVKCMLFHKMKMQDAIDLYGKYVGNWGGTATVYRFEAIKNKKVVGIVQEKPMTEGHLEAICSHTQLIEENTYDVAAIRIQARSQEGNLLYFSQAPVQIIAEGEITVIGPSLISLQGGMGGTYIKTKGKSGKGKLILKSEVYEPVEIQFTIV